MPTIPLTTVKKIALSFFCAMLMVCAASAQPSNVGPPPGAILDLNGTLVPGGGNATYQQYTANFNATGSSTAITFAFREDPAYILFSNVSVTDVDNEGGNLLTNGDFSGDTYTSNGNDATPIGWTYANNYGVTEGGGGVSAECGQGDSNYCWYDGAVQAYDAISQTIQTIPGDHYLISFWVADNSYFSGDGGCYVEDPCYFSDVSINGDTTNRLGNGINVTVYAEAGLPPPPIEPLTVTLLDSGSGTVTDNIAPNPLIDCTETKGVVTGTCSANYPNGTVVILTESTNPGSTFGDWGGACAGSEGTTCTVTMSDVENATASFVIPGQTQSANINPGNPEGPPGPTTTFNFNGGFKEGSPTSGYDFTAQQTDTTQTLLMSVTAIPQMNQQACNALVQANPSFSTAECFVMQNGGGQGVDVPVLFEVTCPPNGSCGSEVNPFDAILGSDFNFFCSENAPLLCGPPPSPFNFGPPNLTSLDGLPAVGFLKGSGPDENHPCTPYPGNNPPLFQSNQIVSFALGDTSTKSIRGASGGSTSCWLATYLTPGVVPTTTITRPVNKANYQQNQSDATTLASYTCTAVNNGNSPTGPYLTVASCTATDSPGGSVANGAQFDTSTTGPHTFTANVEDSALNTGASTVTYYVQGPPGVKSANTATFIEGTPGSFTVTTTGYPYPALTYSPYGSLPAGVSFVDNRNGTATISGTPTVSGVFTFWVIATIGSTRSLQSFTLTVTAPLSVTPSSLAFGSVTVGQPAKKTVTVQNNSGKSVGIGPITLTVTTGAKTQFSLGPVCPAMLTAGNSCTIGVNFTPNAKGADAATLNIVTTAPGSPLKVPITAAGK